MVGKIGTVRAGLNPIGTVFIHGELWKAKAVEDNIKKGVKVIVVGVEGLMLVVKAI